MSMELQKPRNHSFGNYLVCHRQVKKTLRFISLLPFFIVEARSAGLSFYFGPHAAHLMISIQPNMALQPQEAQGCDGEAVFGVERTWIAAWSELRSWIFGVGRVGRTSEQALNMQLCMDCHSHNPPRLVQHCTCFTVNFKKYKQLRMLVSRSHIKVQPNTN